MKIDFCKNAVFLTAAFAAAVFSACIQTPERGGFSESAQTLREAATADGRADAKPLPNVLVCNQAISGLQILDPSKSWSDKSAILWQWTPENSRGLDKKYARTFRFISDCKPVMDCTRVLTVASHGAVAIVRVDNGEVEFFGDAGGNVHSAELLPDGNIVSASSHGNYITLFNRSEYVAGKPCTAQKRYPLNFAHGVVWDNSRRILWGLGRFELAGYEYNFDKLNPELTKKFSYKLPPECVEGHDLYPVAGSKDLLFVSGDAGLAVFNAETRTFEKISDIARIKSVSLSKAGGALIFLVPETRWWAEAVSFGGKTPKKIGRLPDAKIYKARFFVPSCF